MSLRDTADEVFRLWSAGWPFVHLETLEEERALRITDIARSRGARALAPAPRIAGLREQRDPSEPADKPSQNPEYDEPITAIEAFAGTNGPGLLVLVDVSRHLNDPRVARAFRSFAEPLSQNRQCVLMVEPPFELPEVLSEDVARLVLPPPDLEELGELLDSVATFSDRDAILSAALGLSEKAARRAFAVATRAEDEVESVLAEKRRKLRDTFAIEVIDSDLDYSDVGGLDTLKRWLEEREKAFAPEAKAFGLPTPKGALLLGIQGCGKSISAKAVASHWRLPLMRLDLATVFGGGMPAERALRRAIALVEQQAPAVLWIDEIEKGFAGADPKLEQSVAEVSRVLGAFTTWLQEKESQVFVVATANEVTGLPPELLRRGRFDEIFFVDLPDAQARSEVLSVHLRRRGREPSAFPLAELSKATEHFSGAELEQVVVSGLYRAFRESRELTAADLERAASDSVPLFRTYEERIKELRAWAKARARPAGRSEEVIDLLLGT